MFGEGLPQLIGLIYDAPLVPDGWTRVLESLRTILGSRQNALFVQDLADREGPANIVASSGYDLAFVDSYRDYYAAKNIFLPRTLSDPVGTVRLTHTICSEREILSTEFYEGWMKPQDQLWGVTGLLLRDDSAQGMISCLRGPRDGPFGESEREILEVVVPHLQRAVLLHQKIAAVNLLNESVVAAFDRWQMGVILLDSSGRVVLMNKAAEKIANQRDGLVVDRSTITASRSTEKRRLRDLIAQAGQAGKSTAKSRVGAMPVSRESLRRPLQVLVSSFRVKDHPFLLTKPSVILFVNDPEHTPATPETILRQLFGFTVAEAKLALLLMEGKTMAEASAERGITISTARAQLRALLEKTGTRRQAELVRLLSTSPAILASRQG